MLTGFRALFSFLVLTFNTHAAEPRPFATVQPLGLAEARWTSGFWADRFELCRTQMIPSMARLMAGTNYTQFFRNFEIAAGQAEGNSRGASFNDGDFYKWIESACATLAITNDASLHNSLEHIIAIIGQAQRADGYLNTPTLIKMRSDTNAAPFSDRGNFEMYNLGHLFTTAGVHHQATGQTNLLAVAIKAADFLDRSFSNATPESARSPVCPSHYMGLLDLYRATGEPRYLNLAKKLFVLRSEVKDGGDDNQDRIPFDQQTTAAGHAVRANYLYASAADLFMETGDTNLWRPLEPIWRNVTEQKLYLTGGCGALYDGASPDGAHDQKSITKVHQAYGRTFQLPNTTAHNETCANIGNVIWNWRMFLATGEARFMDVVELALYNSVLSGVSLDGTNFFYANPLRVTDPLPTELRWSRQRVPFVSSFCCPPNLLRTIAESAQYAYAKSSSRDASSPARIGDGGVAATPTIWVNLYGANELETELPGGGTVKLVQATEYPWNGRIRIIIKAAPEKGFALKLRIPGWSRDAQVRVNHRAVAAGILPAVEPGFQPGGKNLSNAVAAVHSIDSIPSNAKLGGKMPPSTAGRMPAATYAELRRIWKSGDIVDLDLQMETELIEANPLVEETLGQVAVKRGPIVYCLESVDLPPGVKPLDVSLSPDITLRARHDQRLLGGIAVLEGQALARTNANWSGQLYRELHSSKPTAIKLRLIPYSVWANRGPSEMSVWLRLNLPPAP
jgi:uncharacterized protein